MLSDDFMSRNILVVPRDDDGDDDGEDDVGSV